jgi:hypothetical protein
MYLICNMTVKLYHIDVDTVDLQQSTSLESATTSLTRQYQILINLQKDITKTQKNNWCIGLILKCIWFAIWQLNSTPFPQRVKNDKNIYNWVYSPKCQTREASHRCWHGRPSADYKSRKRYYLLNTSILNFN